MIVKVVNWNIAKRAVGRRLAADAPLIRTGVVYVEDRDGEVGVVERLRRLTRSAADRKGDPRELLFDPAPNTELEWSDFDHIAADQDHVERLVCVALLAWEPGVNILIFGAPGTVKTTFCRAVARWLEVPLLGVGEVDEDGPEPTRKERLQEFRLAQNLLGTNGHSLLLFDEMEDLIAEPSQASSLTLSEDGPCRAVGSKDFMNRLLERNPMPRFWTANAAARLVGEDTTG